MADPAPVNLSAFWPNFNDASVYAEVTCDYGEGSLAANVLNYFGVDCDDPIGGQLEDLDIKHMDALTVVKLSLLQESADDGYYYEPIMNYEDNKVEFMAVGTYAGGIEDIYYTVATFNYVEECVGVMITGKKPLPERNVLAWKPIWGELTPEQRIFDTTDMITSCGEPDFAQYATIVYPDPHLTQGTAGYEDGIDNLFEQGRGNVDLGPYDNVLGYVKFKDPGSNATVDTTITHNNISEIPIRIGHTGLGSDDKPYVGKKLAKRPTFNQNLFDSQCWDDVKNLGTLDLTWEEGVKVTIPDIFRFVTTRDKQEDTFLGIEKVYFLGIEIELNSIPINPEKSVVETPSAADGEVLITVNNSNTVVIELDRGVHWEVAYKKVEDGADWKEPYIIFADNGEHGDPIEYGNNVSFETTVTSHYYDDWDQAIEEGQETIIPLGSSGDKMRGVIVKQIWAVAKLETPSITIYDPSGGGGHPFGNVDNRALEIARDFDCQLAPIILTEEPAPIGYNGRVIDQTEHIVDHDPTTAQDLEEADLNVAMDEMSGGSGLSLNLSFLDEEQVKTLSGVLYTFMNSTGGQETVYTCGPDIDPKIGGFGANGGVVNQINYSYTDSQAYTISINEGPRIIGQAAQIATGPYFKAADSVSMNGVITEDWTNHIHYTIRLDGYGERVAINCCDKILRVGDRVQCTVHNVPQEA